MHISGTIKLNGKIINSLADYFDKIAYVMYDDILLPTMTPKEVFSFIVNLNYNELNEQKL